MLLALALLSAAAAAGNATVDPCAHARAPLPDAKLDRVDRERLSAYRAAWARACQESGKAHDLVPLLAEARTLAGDVRLAHAAATVADAAAAAGGTWPLPGIRRDEGGALRADWAAFAAAAASVGTVDDQRFWRAAAVATDRDGDPVWIAYPDGAPCLRLAGTDWGAILGAIATMERARDEPYARHGRTLRERLVETFRTLGAGGEVLACERGDVVKGFATVEAVIGPVRVQVAPLADAAQKALASGKTRVRWQAPAAAAAPAPAPTPAPTPTPTATATATATPAPSATPAPTATPPSPPPAGAASPGR